ncbi:hypothetical protein A5628_07080 [Mycobacterium colombiense]|uniref:Uncharacterized protein n=2 Tax=Mycobacterium colombiense TaxID=339268 RepID=A0A853LYX5_9MYCO|nr:hypothetical protein A5628_07080 [Mycobacterium colombiense]OBJ72272.1 hypothetical protein A5627_21905 [Mycobacterium colombiense]
MMTGGPGSGDAHYLITMSELVTAVYYAAVQDAVAIKEHHDLVRSIPDLMRIPEYQTGEEI